MSEAPISRRARRRALAGRRGFRNQVRRDAPSTVRPFPLPSDDAAAPRYLRFTITAPDELTGIPLGLFQAGYRLRGEGRFLTHEATWFSDVVSWFDEHLAGPPNRGRWLPDCAVFWFRERAREHVQRMRGLAVLLAHHGLACRTLRTTRPGRVVFEDEHQVAAVPYRDSPR